MNGQVVPADRAFSLSGACPLWYRDRHRVCLVCQALGIKGGTWTDPRPYCPRPQWQLPNHVTLCLNTHGHSPELTAPPTIHMLAYLLSLKKSYVLIMGLINVPKSITLRHTTEHETIQAPDSRRILLAPTYFKSIYQAWGWEKFNICTCGLDHSGSEPFNYYYAIVASQLQQIQTPTVP